MYEQHILNDSGTLRQIEEALLATYFKNYDQDFLQTETGQEDIKANVFRRYNNALAHVVPWVARQIDLRGKTLVEIGSGTGSSTAAFAHFVEKIDGYDIDAQALAGAQARLEVMGLNNVALHLVAAEQLVATLRENHPNGADIVLLFAVLEHQTIRERHETLQLCWQLLNPDGLLVVTETPNLLCYTDLHTSELPFLHLLPSELYVRYADRSLREGFGKGFASLDSMPTEQLDRTIMRWGRGVSFHDFELAIGKEHGKYLVANGFEPEILTWFDVSLEEELLRHYFLTKKLDVPLAFSRVVLNVIYKKSERLLPEPELASAPESIFVADKYLLREQNFVINRLNEQLTAAEKHLNEVLASKRWRIGNLIAAPYRKLKALLS
ncbi:class I SAM-dependent methyltransferase [Candidatus Electronema sp. TJ]|uniref:class I SAM-dependent methyltransferase n=1 Tax=Candidatus Electronema sp. TJ TaxID=3401573 RepID=UPI003AA903E8